MNKMIRPAVFGLMLALLPWSRAAEAPPLKSDSGSKKLIFDLSFKGGTPAELLAAMEKAAAQFAVRPEPINAVIPSDLANVPIPRMELRGVTAAGVFETLTLLDPSIRWISATDGIKVLTRRDARKTQAFYIGHLLKKFKVDDITTAVKTTWDMGGKNVQVDLKYHEDTQLLIARAQPPEIQAMSDVIAQLQIAVDPLPTLPAARAEK